MPSFDIVSELDKVELRNAVEQANKGIANRFDFKGADARIEQGKGVLTLFADDGFRLEQLYDVLVARMAKRGGDVRCLARGEVEEVGGNRVRQVVTVRQGVGGELAKRIVRLIKDSRQKVQTSLQGEAVRVCGAKKDVLQEVIALVRRSVSDVPLQY